MELSVLSGDEEARLSFVGATRTLLEPPRARSGWSTSAAAPPRSRSGTPTAAMTWSESFRIGSGFLADSYLRSDPPAVAELETVRRHVDGTFEGLEPPRPRARSPWAAPPPRCAGCVGAELEHETLERGIRVPVEHADRPRSPSASSSTPSGCGCCPPASWSSRRCRTCSGCRCASRAAVCARASSWSWSRAGGLAARAIAASSSGRSSTLSSPFSTPARPPFFMRTCAPVQVVDGHREVGVVAHQQHVLAETRRERLRVEGAAGELRLELRLDAQRLAGQPRGVRGAQLRTRQARVQLHPERGQRAARGARLPLTLLRERPLCVRRSVSRLPMAQQPDHGRAPYIRRAMEAVTAPSRHRRSSTRPSCT